MTISQVIQTISLGNYTYFTVLHAYFSQISPHSCDNAAVVRHQCHVGLGHIGMGRIGMDCIGHGLNWHGCYGHGAHWLGCTGSGCIALDHFVSLKRFTQNKKLRISKNPFCFQAPLVPWTATRNQKTSPEKKIP